MLTIAGPITLGRGGALLDVLLTVIPSEGEAIRLLTHSSRRLGTTIDWGWQPL